MFKGEVVSQGFPWQVPPHTAPFAKGKQQLGAAVPETHWYPEHWHQRREKEGASPKRWPQGAERGGTIPSPEDSAWGTSGQLYYALPGLPRSAREVGY